MEPSEFAASRDQQIGSHDHRVVFAHRPEGGGALLDERAHTLLEVRVLWGDAGVISTTLSRKACWSSMR
eukprot:CAMPEP_0172753600 /NCGR_PEP_ID=MMETSP1074-20121228/156305_1 /TAXON_ID=2916 /ORGANISM="Ceratium fusus, Strain PA161109" /LENGTH=68 /DNA_ID=CAMNT_0013586317 /DNA_START=31 /DNA_END=235 /DNA_ORIENTATION=+